MLKRISTVQFCNNVLTRYELKSGSDIPLVFLHGFLGTAVDWAPIAAHLPFRCIAFDLPGHGASPFAPNFCEMLFESVRDLPNFHFIGYSMGGRLALQYAARYPVESLTLVSAHLGLKTEEERSARLQKDVALSEQIRALSIDEFLKIWYDQPLFKTLMDKMDIRKMRSVQDKEAIAAALTAFSLGNQPDLSHLQPYIIVGEFDAAYRAQRHDAIVSNTGHAVHLENPQELAGVLYDRLR